MRITTNLLLPLTIRYRSPHPRSNGKDKEAKDNKDNATTKDMTHNPSTTSRENSGMLEEQYDSEFPDAAVLEPNELNNNNGNNANSNNINTLNASTLSSLSTRIKPHRYQSTSSIDEEEQQGTNQLPPLFPQEDGQGISSIVSFSNKIFLLFLLLSFSATCRYPNK